MKKIFIVLYIILPLMDATAVTCSTSIKNEGDCRTCTCPGYGYPVNRNLNPSTGKCRATCSQACPGDHTSCSCNGGASVGYNGSWYYCDCRNRPGHGDYCETCLPGYYGVQRKDVGETRVIYECFPCPKGSYKADISTPPACNTCPDGGTTTSTGATDITSCLYLSDKNYLDNTGTYIYTEDCYYTN